ncbi:MAG TPA: glycosyltransferase family 4 protein [Rhodanobacteraceae bacterium]
MRILIVTRNLPPLVGGMERLNWHMAEELSKVADVRIVGPEGSAALAPAGVMVREAPLKPLWKFLWRARSLARQEARHWNPDVVLAGSGLTAPIARSAARGCGARTAVYVHGLDVAVRHLVYRTIWLPAIRRADRVIANSRATAQLCRGIGVDPARIGIVHPGVGMPRDVYEPSPCATRHLLPEGEGNRSEPLFPRERGRGEGPDPRDAVGFRERHALGGRPLLLSVGRLSARKGLREFVTRALPRIVAVRPDTMLLIVGEAPNQALHAQAQTPCSIRAVAREVGLADNLLFLGTITDYIELGAVYCTADVHVFPVREIRGDPEGFGMVAVEAAAHGLPTVAFATGGVVDAVGEGQSGHLIRPGDYNAFADAVLRALSQRDALRRRSIDFARQFAWPEFGTRISGQLKFAKEVARGPR